MAEPRVKKVCRYCGSEDIRRDADATWDPALFLNEADAIARYRALAKDFEHQLDGKVDEMTDDELFRQVHDRQDSDDDLYLYETEVK
jgi:hypothetical protein